MRKKFLLQNHICNQVGGNGLSARVGWELMSEYTRREILQLILLGIAFLMLNVNIWYALYVTVK
jgi:hypothetical protein